jgi:hypothetical protein
MGSSSSARGLDISIAFEHYRSSSASRADVNSPGPAYGCPGSASALPSRHILPRAGIQLPLADIGGFRPAYKCSGQNTHFLAGIRRSLAGIRVCGPGWAIPSLPRPACEQARPIPAAPRLSPLLGRTPASAAPGPRVTSQISKIKFSSYIHGILHFKIISKVLNLNLS